MDVVGDSADSIRPVGGAIQMYGRFVMREPSDEQREHIARVRW